MPQSWKRFQKNKNYYIFSRSLRETHQFHILPKLVHFFFKVVPALWKHGCQLLHKNRKVMICVKDYFFSFWNMEHYFLGKDTGTFMSYKKNVIIWWLKRNNSWYGQKFWLISNSSWNVTHQICLDLEQSRAI